MFRLSCFFCLWVGLVTLGRCLVGQGVDGEVEPEGVLLSAAERAWIAGQPDLAVYTYAGLPPYIFEENGRLKGLLVDAHRELTRLLGVDIPLRLIERSEAARAGSELGWPEFERGEIQALFPSVSGVGRYEDQALESDVFFSTYALAYQIPKVTGSGDADLLGKRVGIYSNNYSIYKFAEAYAPTAIKVYRNQTEQLDALLQGEIDWVLGSPAFMEMAASRNVPVRIDAMFGGAPIGVGYQVRREWAPLVEILNKGIAAMSEEVKLSIQSHWLAQRARSLGLDIRRIELSEEERAWLDRHPEIPLAVPSDAEPLVMREAGGRLTGAAIEYAQVVARQLGVRFLFKPMAPAEFAGALERGEVLGVWPVVFNPESAWESMFFTQPVGKTPIYVFGRRETESKQIETWSDLVGSRVGHAGRSGILGAQLRRVSGVEIIPFGDTQALAQALHSGELDWAVGLIELPYLLEKRGMDARLAAVFEDAKIGGAFAWVKDAGPVVTAIDKAIRSIPEAFERDLLRKWAFTDLPRGSREKFASSLAVEEEDWLMRNRVLAVGRYPMGAPLLFQTRGDGAGGMVADLLRSVEEVWGSPFAISQYSDVNKARQALKEGEVAAMVDIRQHVGDREGLSQTDPFLTIPYKIFTREDKPFIRSMDVMRGMRVAVVQGTSVERRVQVEYPQVVVESVASAEIGLRGVRSGRFDAFLGEVLSTLNTLSSAGVSGVVLGGDTPYVSEVVFLHRTDQPFVGRLLEQALRSLSVEEREAIYRRWAPAAVQVRADTSLVWKIGTPVLFLVLAIILWNRQLKRMVARRTADLTRRELGLRSLVVAESESYTENFYEIMARSMRESTGADFALFGVLEPGRTIRTIALVDESGALPGTVYDLEGTPCSGVVDFQTCLHAEHVADRFPEDVLLAQMGIEGYLGKAILGRDKKPVGIAVCLFRERIENADVLDSLIGLYALRVGGSIARNNAEEALRVSREHVRATLDSIGDAVVATDLKGNVERMNPVAEHLTGWAECDAVGQSISAVFEVLDLASRAPVDNPVLTLLAGGQSGSELPVRKLLRSRKDGNYIVSDTATLIVDEGGQSLGVVLVFRDVTHEYWVERALRESEQRLTAVIENTRDVLFAFDKGLRLVAFNSASSEAEDFLFGVPLKMGRRIVELLDEERGAVWRQLLQRAMLGERFSWEARYTVEGEPRFFEFSFNPMGEHSQVDGVVVFGRDFTRRKMAEIEIEESKIMLENVLDTIPVRVFWKDPDGVFIGCNHLFAKDAGVERPERIVGQTDISLGFVEQAEHYRSDDLRVIEKGESVFEHQFPFTGRDGRRIWLNSAKVPLRDPEGKIFGVLGMYEDVTEQKLMDIELKQTQGRMEQQRNALGRLASDHTIAFGGVDDAVDVLTRVGAEVLGVDRLSVWLFSSGGDVLTCRSLYRCDQAAHLRNLILRRDDFPDYLALLDAAGRISFEDVRNDGRITGFFQKYLEPVGIRALLNATFAIEGEVRGAVGAAQRHHTRKWHSDEEAFMATLGAIVGQILLNDERRHAMQELRAAEVYLSSIINSMPSVLIGLDREGRVTQWNASAVERTQIKSEVAQGQHVGAVFPALVPELPWIFETFVTGQWQTQRRTISGLVEGRERIQDLVVFPLAGEGAEGVVVRIDDVTEKVRLEEMMIQSEKMLSVGGLAAGMAHEINNPLAGIMQTANVLKQRLEGDAAREMNMKTAEKVGLDPKAMEAYLADRGIFRMLETISDSGKRVARIVDNMLKFARKSDAQFSSVSLVTLVEETLELAYTDYHLKKDFDFKRIRIEKDFSEGSVAVPCESGEIQQVILNILRNGAEAMQHAAVKEPVLRIRVSADAARGYGVIEISDNGPGMDEVTRKRIFEPFFTTKPVGVGTGLGLSVSYFIITENHRGELLVESAPGEGAKFVVALPGLEI